MTPRPAHDHSGETNPPRLPAVAGWTRDVLWLGAGRIVAYTVVFPLNIILARWLGAAEFGAYSYQLSSFMVLATLSTLGLERLTLRTAATHRHHEQWPRLRQYLSWAMVRVSAASVCVFAAFSLTLPWWGQRIPLFGHADWMLGIMIPLIALGNLQQATLRGLGKQVSAQLLFAAGQPVLFGLVLAAAILIGKPSSAGIALQAQALAWALVFGFSVLWVLKRVPAAGSPDAGPISPAQGEWSRPAFYFFLLAGLEMANSRIDFFTLGFFANSEHVGLYAAASRVAGVIPLFLGLGIAAAAPALAQLHSAKKMVELQQLVTRITLGSSLIALPVALILILFGGQVLAVFGHQFRAARQALAILSAGQIINVLAGPVATLLTLTGHEKQALAGLAVSACSNALLSWALIPRFGLEGAACASAASLVLWNVLLACAVRRHLGIQPAALAWKN